jgi:hypothetical protein
MPLWLGGAFFNEGYDINKEDKNNNTMVTAMTTTRMMISFFDATILIAGVQVSIDFLFVFLFLCCQTSPHCQYCYPVNPPATAATAVGYGSGYGSQRQCLAMAAV